MDSDDESPQQMSSKSHEEDTDRVRHELINHSLII